MNVDVPTEINGGGTPMERISNQEKARRARTRVLDELRRRGAVNVSVTQIGNRHEIHATSLDTARAYTLWSKTKASGDWQTTTTLGEPRREDPAETSFWVLEDRGHEPFQYFVVPDWWMTNYIHREITNHLAAHGGRRPFNPASTHCAVKPSDVAEWRGRWDLLGLQA
jgi:hypothetical protein